MAFFQHVLRTSWAKLRWSDSAWSRSNC